MQGTKPIFIERTTVWQACGFGVIPIWRHWALKLYKMWAATSVKFTNWRSWGWQHVCHSRGTSEKNVFFDATETKIVKKIDAENLLNSLKTYIYKWFFKQMYKLSTFFCSFSKFEKLFSIFWKTFKNNGLYLLRLRMDKIWEKMSPIVIKPKISFKKTCFWYSRIRMS